MAVRFRELHGTPTGDFLVGDPTFNYSSADTVRYGFRGDDSLGHGYYADTALLIGGAGNDTYFSEGGKVSFILDGGFSPDDVILSQSISPFNYQTYTALVDGRHFAAINPVTGEAIYVLDYMSSANRIESLVGDRWVGSFQNFVDVAAVQPLHLGNISWEGLRKYGILQPYSTAEIDEAISHYSERARVIDAQYDGAPTSGVFRFYNSDTGVHFYTSTVGERDAVAKNLPQFQYEGVAFSSAPAAGDDTVALYRFYNSETGVHFFTASDEERDSVVQKLPQFHYEGPGFSAYLTDADDRNALHRFYNSEAGTHFYTANELEKVQILGTLPQYQYEGVAAYVDI